MWISGISGPFGPCGTDAVVMTGIFASVATLASVVALERTSVKGMSLMVWNRPLWWSINSIAALSGSMTGRAPLKLAVVAGVPMVDLLWGVRKALERAERAAPLPGPSDVRLASGRNGRR